MNNVAKNNVDKSTYYYAVIVVMMIPQTFHSLIAIARHIIYSLFWLIFWRDCLACYQLWFGTARDVCLR